MNEKEACDFLIQKIKSLNFGGQLMKGMEERSNEDAQKLAHRCDVISRMRECIELCVGDIIQNIDDLCDKKARVRMEHEDQKRRLQEYMATWKMLERDENVPSFCLQELLIGWEAFYKNPDITPKEMLSVAAIWRATATAQQANGLLLEYLEKWKRDSWKRDAKQGDSL